MLSRDFLGNKCIKIFKVVNLTLKNFFCRDLIVGL